MEAIKLKFEICIIEQKFQATYIFSHEHPDSYLFLAISVYVSFLFQAQ